MAQNTKAFGTHPNGQEITIYTISNQNGMKAELSTLGAALVRLYAPDKDGNLVDVVLGYATGEDYMDNDAFFGVIVGPNANRIGGAQFELDGETYKLDPNDGPCNNLHSHKTNGYHKMIWNAEATNNSVIFTLNDNKKDMGFPGDKQVRVTYTLNDDNGLKIEYYVVSDQKTVLNLTNHSYFNMDGHQSGSIEKQKLWIGASSYTPSDDQFIVHGEIAPVAGTPMDFTEAKEVGRDIEEDFIQLKQADGYDHNWVLDGWDGTLRHFATLQGAKSGIVMKAYTTLPGVQFYAGNMMTERLGKDGVVYNRRGGLCLETQYFPNSVNCPAFPNSFYEAGVPYESVTEYRFEVQK